MPFPFLLFTFSLYLFLSLSFFLLLPFSSFSSSYILCLLVLLYFDNRSKETFFVHSHRFFFFFFFFESKRKQICRQERFLASFMFCKTPKRCSTTRNKVFCKIHNKYTRTQVSARKRRVREGDREGRRAHKSSGKEKKTGNKTTKKL